MSRAFLNVPPFLGLPSHWSPCCKVGQKQVPQSGQNQFPMTYDSCRFQQESNMAHTGETRLHYNCPLTHHTVQWLVVNTVRLTTAEKWHQQCCATVQCIIVMPRKSLI